MTQATLQVLLFLLGIVGLYLGAEWLVRGASRLARVWGVSALAVGLTVVAFGTSAPELVVGMLAAAQGQPDLALGNVLGSNVINIALILGVSAIIMPIAVRATVIRREIPIMIALTVVAGVLGLNRIISRADGAVLLLLFAAYIAFVLHGARDADPEAVPGGEELDEVLPEQMGWRAIAWNLAMVAVGIVTLFFAAKALVTSAVFFARELGISELVIGLTVVAMGTSLPELATVLVAAIRRKTDIAVGNIVGSNIFNICAILGAAAVMAPIPFAGTVLTSEYLLMLLVSLALLALARKQHRLARREGIILVILYFAFTGMIIFGAPW